MENKKYLSLIIGILSLIVLVGAIQITNFDGYGTNYNLTFSGDSNITRNISIYKNANVTSAVMNLSGYELEINETEQDTANDTDWLNSSALSYLFSPQYAYDGNWVTNAQVKSDGLTGTTFSPRIAYIYENFTIPVNNFKANITSKYRAYTTGSGGCLATVTLQCKNSTDSYITVFIDSATNDATTHTNTFEINDDCITSSTLDIRTTLYIRDATGTSACDSSKYMDAQYYESKILWYAGSFPNDSYIQINNTQIWNHTGEFNSTFSPNKTSDFSSTLNTALNGGLCDCDGCSLSGDNCSINFTFHSDTAGVLEYSTIDINWLESTNPNLTITKPTGEYTTSVIPYNVSTSDDYATDFCTYWVMRGASVEVANTTVNCSSEITGNLSVSSQNTNYAFHFFVNDTSGNSNTTTSNFSTSEDAIIIITGGGGGSAPPILEQEWTMEAMGGGGKFEADMVKGIKRTFRIQFENLGDSSRTIDLSCEDIEGLACKYVEFPEETFELALLKDTKQTVEFIINLPEDAKKGEYQFNIKAIDDQSRDGSVTMFLGIGTMGLIPAFISKVIFSSTNFGFPYALIFFPSLILGFVLFSKMFSKKLPMKAIWVMLSSASISIFLVWLI